VFSSDHATVVTDADRRDARSTGSDADAVGVRGSTGSSPLDLPPPRRDRGDGGELVN
jgi:hypothetical protein